MEKVVVIIPTLNEESCIASVISGVLDIVPRLRGFQLEIIVVDGGSTDRTVEIAKGKGARVYVQYGNGKGTGMRQIFSLRNPQEVVRQVLSLTSDIESGLQTMRVLLDSKYVMMLDGDGTYVPSDLIKIFEALHDGFDVAMGSRFLGKIEKGAMKRLNYIGNIVLSISASMMYQKKITDLCTGMWGFNTSALRQMDLDSDHFELEAEMFAECAKRKLRIKEVPITYRPRMGHSKLIPAVAGFMILRKLIQRRLGKAGTRVSKATKKKETGVTLEIS